MNKISQRLIERLALIWEPSLTDIEEQETLRTVSSKNEEGLWILISFVKI